MFLLDLYGFFAGMVVLILIIGLFVRIINRLTHTIKNIFQETGELLSSGKKDKSVFGEYIDYLYKKDYLMTKRENIFFINLSEYIKDKDYLICPKVRLEDIIGVRTTSKGLRPWKASSRLDRAHVDFVLIGKTDFVTKLAIELDDITHDNSYGIDHDKAKNEAFEKVGVKLLRFRDPNTPHEEFIKMGI